MKIKFPSDLYWCKEGCGFVDKNHRCEQWCHIYKIPKEAVSEIINLGKRCKKI